MSAAAASPTDGLEAVTSDQAIKAGIIAAALGGSAMIARLLLQSERASLGFIVRSSVAACVTAYFVNLAARDYITSESLRVCVCGIAGFAAPEIQNYGLEFLKAKMQGKVNEAKRSASIKAGKPAKPKKGKKNNGKR
jgi:ABC-type enterobactin transport system permease subunit